jgi:hypothetical protein
LSNVGNKFGDLVTFVCDEGYQYNNSTTGVLECQANSNWSGDTKGCQRMSVTSFDLETNII